MTLLIVLLLMVAAALFSLVKWRRTQYGCAALALALFFGVGCGPIPAALVGDLQAGYSSDVVVREAGRSAIVLLGNGTERFTGAGAPTIEVGPFAFGRLVKTFDLYQACKQRNSNCTVVVTGGDPAHNGASEAAVYGARLRQLGVSPSDLVLEERSLNTWQNAQYTAALLRPHPFDQVYLVTSGIHLRRGELYFGRFHIQAIPVRADSISATSSLIPLSYNFLLADLAIHEYVGVVRYYVYERMGWNAAAEHAGSV